MIELQPSPLSEIVVPNFTVLELNGAFEVYFGIKIALGEVGGFQASGLTYTIDLDEGTYILTEKDPLEIVAGPVGLSLSEWDNSKLSGSAGSTEGPVNTSETFGSSVVTLDLGQTGSSAAGLGASASANNSCDVVRRVFLIATVRTLDPPKIVLARTYQSAAWNANLCLNELTSVHRYFWGNPDTIPWAGPFTTNWYEISSEANSSQLFQWHAWTYATATAVYQNDNFLGPFDFFSRPKSTWALHKIDFDLDGNYAYLDYYTTHWGFMSWLLKGDLDHVFREQF